MNTGVPYYSLVRLFDYIAGRFAFSIESALTAVAFVIFGAYLFVSGRGERPAGSDLVYASYQRALKTVGALFVAAGLALAFVSYLSLPKSAHEKHMIEQGPMPEETGAVPPPAARQPFPGVAGPVGVRFTLRPRHGPARRAGPKV
jgi:hypothetical protein